MARQSVPSSIDTAITTGETRVTVWRARAIAFLRIVFGVIWGIDAWFKWQPGFINSFASQISGAQQGQPGGIKAWLGF
jgi:hypothetical protein